MTLRKRLSLPLLALAAFAQQYSGPRPPKPDIPYLVHADNLLQTEVGEAKEEKGKGAMLSFVIKGANSSAKTPLASPIFLLRTDKLDADKLQLFRLDSNKGKRAVLYSKRGRRTAQTYILNVTPVGKDNLFRIEVDQSLTPGEYALTPEGSNQVFCFAVF
jgi:hypothetical protein